jgi:nucleoside-diphosphate kinase
MVGTTDPKDSAPGTIRGDYSHVTRAYANSRNGTLPNIIHASGDLEEAKQEVPLWFNEDELYSYSVPHETTLHGKIVKK